MAGTFGVEEAKGRIIMALGESDSTGGGGGGADAAGVYGGASRKLEELFTYWLSQRESQELVESCVTAVRQGQALPCDSSLEPPQLTLRGLSGAAAAHMSLVTNQPPRSPREPSAHSPPPAASPLGLNKRPLASISTAGAPRGANMMVEGESEPRQQPSAAAMGGAGAGEDRQSKMMDESNDVEDEGTGLSSSVPTPTSSFASPLASSSSPPAGRAGGSWAGPAGSPPLQPLQAAHQRRSASSSATGEAAPAERAPPPVLRLQLDGGGTGGRGRPYAEDSLEKRRPQIEAMYARLVAASGRRGLTAADMGEFTKGLCRLPRFLHLPLFERIWALYGGGRDGGGTAAIGEGQDSRMAEEGADGAPSPLSTELAGAAIRGDEEAATTAAAAGAAASAAAAPAAAGEEGGERVVSLEAVLRFWGSEMAPYDDVDRLFRLLKQPGAAHLVKEDLFPFLRQLLEAHPGLEFLRSHPDFQQKYALTAAARVFYALNRSGTGKITARELRRSRLLAAMRFVDENEDINKETAFFSYEHFYVLYCRFWELDTDRDGALSREDVLKYGEHSLSNVIVDRVFEVGARPFEDGLGGKRRSKERERMQYEDFIYFMLSEEDKGNEASLRYWFHCVDVDGDGRLSLQDMRYFYNVQLQRMEWLGHELVPFEDVLCQMLDMLKPTREIKGSHLHLLRAQQQAALALAAAPPPTPTTPTTATAPRPAAAAPGPAAALPVLPAAAAVLAAQEAEVQVGGLFIEDFLRSDKIRIAGVFFDALFNLNKFIAFEQRDPFGDRQKREDPFDSDWERFAYRDYQQLAMDEEENEGGTTYSEEAEEQQATSMDIEEEDDDEDDDEEEQDEDRERQQQQHAGVAGAGTPGGGVSGGGSDSGSGSGVGMATADEGAEGEGEGLAALKTSKGRPATDNGAGDDAFLSTESPF